MGFKNIQLRTEDGKAGVVNLINFGLRALQFLVGLTTIVLYATQPAYQQWSVAFGRSSLKWSLGTAAGAIAIATSPFLALIPFFTGYTIVAWAFVWDFIVMVVYAATFAYFKHWFPSGIKGDAFEDQYITIWKISKGRVDTMRAAVWIDLVGMLLWLITLLMAIGLLVFGKIRGNRVVKY